MSVTLKDVAARAGVSRSAVSRTYTAGASVSPETRRKVEAAARALGYQPNILARSLTTRSTKMIGLVSNNFHNPAFLQIFDLFTRGLQERGLRPLLVNLSDETDPTRSLQMLQQYSVDGVILASSTLPPAFALAFHDAGLPIVQAFGRSSDGGRVHSVGIDNHHAGALAAQTLIARGYRHIGFLGGPETATSSKDRATGFLAEVALHGAIRATVSYATAYSFEAGHAEMLRLLQAPCAEAYFCGDDVLAIGALAAATGAGFAVPDEIGLIGLNDMEMSGWANINLTTIAQPFAAIIAAAIEVLTTLLAKPDLPPAVQIFACSIVERGTLRRLPA